MGSDSRARHPSGAFPCVLLTSALFLPHPSLWVICSGIFFPENKEEKKIGDDEQMDGHPSSVRGVCLLLIVWCTPSLGEGEGRRYSRFGKYSFLFVFLFNYA